MSMLAERERLEREREFHELDLQRKRLAHLLGRCNSFATQATLVSGFSFTSFSVDALTNLSFTDSPYRSFAFVASAAMTITLSISVVGVASFIELQAEKVAMEVDVRTAVSLVKWRMGWVLWPFYGSLAFLWLSAALTVFAVCHSDASDNESMCDASGVGVILIFVLVGGPLTIFPRVAIARDVAKAYQIEAQRRAAGANTMSMREPLASSDMRDSATFETHSMRVADGM